jgi:hypothetical protein
VQALAAPGQAVNGQPEQAAKGEVDKIHHGLRLQGSMLGTGPSRRSQYRRPPHQEDVKNRTWLRHNNRLQE